MEKRVTKIRARRKPTTRKASTKDVLADSARTQKVPRKWAAHYKRLLELRDHFSGERGALKENAREESPQYSLHMADAGTDSYDRDWALGMLSNEQDAVYEIDQALDRIRNGTYGVCEMTGKPISEQRLEAIPWTRFSAAAEKQVEKRGQARRAGLGRRETVPRMSTESKVGDEQQS